MILEYGELDLTKFMQYKSIVLIFWMVASQLQKPMPAKHQNNFVTWRSSCSA